MSSTKLVSLQCLRAVAVLGVILFHSNGFNRLQSDNLYPYFNFGAAGVDLFFVISGFIIWLTSSANSIPSFYVKRLWRILPMYWLISLALIAIMLLQGKTIPNSKVVSSLLLIPTDSPPLLNVGWSLIHEIYFYLLFGLLIAIRSSSLRFAALWTWALSSSLYYFLYFPAQPWLQLLCNPFNLEFALGASIAYFFSASPLKKPQFLLYALISFGLCLHLWLEMYGWIFPESIERVVYFAIPLAMFVATAAFNPVTSNFLNALLEKIGDASYSIYLTHVPLLAALNLTAERLDFHLNWAIACSLCLLAGILCYQLLEQPLIRQLPLLRQKLGY